MAEPSQSEFTAPVKRRIDKELSLSIMKYTKAKKQLMTSKDLDLVITMCQNELDKRRGV